MVYASALCSAISLSLPVGTLFLSCIILCTIMARQRVLKPLVIQSAQRYLIVVLCYHFTFYLSMSISPSFLWALSSILQRAFQAPINHLLTHRGDVSSGQFSWINDKPTNTSSYQYPLIKSSARENYGSYSILQLINQKHRVYIWGWRGSGFYSRPIPLPQKIFRPVPVPDHSIKHFLLTPSENVLE